VKVTLGNFLFGLVLYGLVSFVIFSAVSKVYV
jgi:formate/nitrite transporter FocA (FNT family)